MSTKGMNALLARKQMRKDIKLKTASYALQEHVDEGAQFSNQGASGAVTLTLLEALAGRKAIGYVDTAQNLILDPGLTAGGDDTNQIANPVTGALMAAGDTIYSNKVGSMVELVCRTKGKWEIERQEGDWYHVIAKIANYTVVEIADQDKFFSNAAAEGAITFALPAATVGQKYNFDVEAAQELRIDPNGTETIALPSTGAQGAAGKYLTANAIGERVSIECKVAGTWNVLTYIGTWTAEG